MRRGAERRERARASGVSGYRRTEITAAPGSGVLSEVWLFHFETSAPSQYRGSECNIGRSRPSSIAAPIYIQCSEGKAEELIRS